MELKSLKVDNLLLDLENPRLVEKADSQGEALRAIVRESAGEFMALAQHLAVHGKDPGDLPIVIPAPKSSKEFIALDANRRLAALKALEKPSLVAEVLTAPQREALADASATYKKHQTREVTCVVEKDRLSADPWLRLRHGGKLGGAGRVDWGAQQKARYAVRMGAQKPFEVQALDLAQEPGGDLTEAERIKVRLSTFERIIASADAREVIGIEERDGVLHTRAPAAEVARALAHIARDIAYRRVKVGNVYDKAKQLTYLNEIPAGILPTQVARRSEDATAAASTGAGTRKAAAQASTSAKAAKGAKGGKKKPPRDYLIPKECVMKVSDQRLSDIEDELRKQLSLTKTPNAVSVLFRVFVELSVDIYLLRNGHDEMEAKTLGQKMKAVAHDLAKQKKITKKELEAVLKASMKDSFLGPSVDLMHGFIHNPNFFPTATELRGAWSGIEPFMVAIWSDE